MVPLLSILNLSDKADEENQEAQEVSRGDDFGIDPMIREPEVSVELINSRDTKHKLGCHLKRMKIGRR